MYQSKFRARVRAIKISINQLHQGYTGCLIQQFTNTGIYNERI